MKKLLFYPFALLFVASILFTSCSRNSRSVEINGVRWATANVETPRRFASSATNIGGFFTFDEAQRACPRGWRLPTREEFESLRDAGDSEWAVVNEVNGSFFGTENDYIFLPAAGLRLVNGELIHAGTIGYYWSSTPLSRANRWHLWLTETNSDVSNHNRVNGFNVRCVAK